jgi:hypothetical protein
MADFFINFTHAEILLAWVLPVETYVGQTATGLHGKADVMVAGTSNINLLN